MRWRFSQFRNTWSKWEGIRTFNLGLHIYFGSGWFGFTLFGFGAEWHKDAPWSASPAEGLRRVTRPGVHMGGSPCAPSPQDFNGDTGRREPPVPDFTGGAPMEHFTIDWYSIGPWMVISAVTFAIAAGIHTAWSERKYRAPAHECCCDPHRSPVTLDNDGNVWLGCIMQGCEKRFRWSRNLASTERFRTAWEGRKHGV